MLGADKLHAKMPDSLTCRGKSSFPIQIIKISKRHSPSICHLKENWLPLDGRIRDVSRHCSVSSRVILWSSWKRDVCFSISCSVLVHRLLACKNVQEQLSTPQIPRSQRNATGLTLNGSARQDRNDLDTNGKQPDMNELERLFPAQLSSPPDQRNKETAVRITHTLFIYIDHLEHFQPLTFDTPSCFLYFYPLA